MTVDASHNSTIREHERLGYRAPLALICQDGVTGAAVTDGLVATAWPAADTTRVFTAARSPLSGILGFGRLPLPFDASHAMVPAGEPITWPAITPEPYTAMVQDTAGRYLPAVVSVTVPVSTPVVVPLSSSPARHAPSGFATVKGEVHENGTGNALAWSLVRIDTGAAAYNTVADERGRFLLHLPYPEALPPLLGSPPSGPGLSAVAWPLTVTVRSEPGALVQLGPTATAPPELGSVIAQGAAQLVDGGGSHASIAATLAFGTPLVLALTAVPA
jgi:hypothetical protein